MTDVTKLDLVLSSTKAHFIPNKQNFANQLSAFFYFLAKNVRDKYMLANNALEHSLKQ